MTELPTSTLLVCLFGLLFWLILVPSVLGIRYARTAREMEHAERMKALEVGRMLPGDEPHRDEPWWSPARTCVAIGAGVPVGVFVCAYLATESSGYEGGVWFGATAVGVTAVVCGSLLAARHFNQIFQAGPVPHAPKPPADADAFDVVGRRG